MISYRSLLSASNLLEKCLFKECASHVRRHLYSPSSLGVDTFLKTREKVKSRFEGIEEKFKTKMLECTDNEKSSTVFTEDLKNMVHLCDIQDLPQVETMLRKFSKQNKEMRFGSFIFGPVVMRMYYHLNEPTLALQMFKDPDLDGFFDQLISFQILMDLLYINEMYQGVLEVFDIVSNKQLQNSKYPKNAVVLVLAACYKMNTPEAFDYMKNLYVNLNKYGHYPMRRASTFAAALALKQNSPDIALEILTSLKQQSYVTIRNLKLMALAQLNRPEDSLSILRSVLEMDTISQSKHTFAEESIMKASESILKQNNPEMKEEFDKVVKQLNYLGYIVSEPIDSLLCSEISTIPKSPSHDQEYSSRPNFRRKSRFNNDGIRNSKRPGLQDMV